MPRVLAAATLVAAMGLVVTTQAQYLIVGNDEKVAFNDGKPVFVNDGPTPPRGVRKTGGVCPAESDLLDRIERAADLNY